MCICNICTFVLDVKFQEHIGPRSVILRLSGPLKECYAKEHGLDFEKMLSASDYKERFVNLNNTCDSISWLQVQTGYDKLVNCDKERGLHILLQSGGG